MTQPQDIVEDLVTRLAPQISACVRQVGRARGSKDADILLAGCTAGQREHLRYLITGPGRTCGEVAAACAQVGLITKAQLFAPNASGFWWRFQTQTIGMLLTPADHDALTAANKDVTDLACGCQQLCAQALTEGWEDAIADAVLTGALLGVCV